MAIGLGTVDGLGLDFEETIPDTDPGILILLPAANPVVVRYTIPVPIRGLGVADGDVGDVEASENLGVDGVVEIESVVEGERTLRCSLYVIPFADDGTAGTGTAGLSPFGGGRACCWPLGS